MNISAVVVTKGDVDISRVIAALTQFEDLIVYDNSKEQDFKVYGRYVAAKRAKNDIIFTIDDDAVTDAAMVCQHYRDGWVTANVPPERRHFYSDGVTLLGWGAVFDRSLISCFSRYLRRWPMDDLFLRECDRVFTGLNKSQNIDVPFEHLPHAYWRDRMGAEQRHLLDLATIRDRIYSLR